MMHLLTANVDAWWKHVETVQRAVKYSVLIEPIADRPWGLRDFVIADPSGVLWRIGQNIQSSLATDNGTPPQKRSRMPQGR